MGRKDRRLRKLAVELARTHPHIEDPEAVIAGGAVLVDGRIVTNPASLVRVGASITIRSASPLRGEAKLRAALTAFAVSAADRVALDLGASAGGFTRVLLEAGACRVYAVDVGHGQLLGSLRQDRRVVNLERTNLGQLNRTLVPELVEVVTIDLSYLGVGKAVRQLEALRISPHADLIALVKPMFELGLAEPPTDRPRLTTAVERASSSLEASAWKVVGSIESPVAGTKGAIEFLIHARRASPVS